MKTIKITTAANLSDATYDRICRGFSEKYGEDTSFEHIIDDSVIGGFIADINGEILDLSISAQLSKMKQQITGEI